VDRSKRVGEAIGRVSLDWPLRRGWRHRVMELDAIGIRPVLIAMPGQRPIQRKGGVYDFG
jgi:hypothetical protein